MAKTGLKSAPLSSDKGAGRCGKTGSGAQADFLPQARRACYWGEYPWNSLNRYHVTNCFNGQTGLWRSRISYYYSEINSRRYIQQACKVIAIQADCITHFIRQVLERHVVIRNLETYRCTAPGSETSDQYSLYSGVANHRANATNNRAGRVACLVLE
jgi:hypothetical protein